MRDAGIEAIDARIGCQRSGHATRRVLAEHQVGGVEFGECLFVFALHGRLHWRAECGLHNVDERGDRQFVERGLDKSGIKFIAEGSLTEDDIVNQVGDAALGLITSHHYSAAHDSDENKSFVAAFKKANGGMRPNLMAMQSYDGMHLIYEALNKTKGSTNGDALIAAMKGLSWVSPRGPVTIDPETREVIQNIYIRKVERVGGELYNVEFATIPNFKDPSKLKH